MNKKDVKTKSTASLLIIITLAILVIVNLISLNLFSRVDLTDNNIYSLTDSSRELVERLNDRLTVKAYVSNDLPAPHNNDARYIKDLLDDYKAYSHGYLHYEFIDPVKDNKEEEAQGYRIPPLQFNVFKNDKTEFIKGYKGLAVLYGDKSEVIPFVENTMNLEYDLSRAINKLIQTEIPSIAFTTGNGEPDMSNGLNWASQMLQKEYRVRFLDLKDLKTIPPEIRVVFVDSPKEPLSYWEIYLLDQFLMRGGRLVFLIDGFNIDIANASVTPIENGLDSLMYYYGASVRKDLVIDAQCNMVPVTRNMGTYQMQSLIRYPFYINIQNFNEENPIVKTLKSFDMLFTSSLDLNPGLPAATERQVLFSTSDQSGSRMIPIDVSPEKKYFQEDFSSQKLPLAVAMSGYFGSYFNDRNIPEYTGNDSLSTGPIPDKLSMTQDGRVVVIGNGSFISDDNRRNNTSFVILMNIVDWMTQDKGLISIRSKQVTGRMLKVTSDGTKKVVKYVNMFAMPLIVVLFGVVRWQYKRSSRKNREIA
ncbi:MAG: Gldg family protein [Candidatus Zixiibacteriota bacterium]